MLKYTTSSSNFCNASKPSFEIPSSCTIRLPPSHHSRPQDPLNKTGPSIGIAVKSKIPGPLRGPAVKTADKRVKRAANLVMPTALYTG